MRWLVLVLSIGCATGGVTAEEQAATDQQEREWDAFCVNPPPDQVRWCDQREREKDRALLRQVVRNQEIEQKAAERERRANAAREVGRAFQAPYVNQPAPAEPPRRPTSCTSRVNGDTVHTDCW